MKKHGLLLALAQQYRIETEYQDCAGQTHAVAPATLKAILQAMDVPCDSALAMRQALQQARQGGVALLAPTLVLNTQQTATIRLNLPLHQIGQPMRWRICQESGEVLEQGFDFSQLRCISQSSTDVDGYLQRALSLGLTLPEGYHQFELYQNDRCLARSHLIVTPERCFRPQAVSDERRIWGVDAQLHSLRSRHSWGVGDFSDLVRLVDSAAALGADAIGLNPVHGQLLLCPEKVDAFCPASRLYLDIAYLDVEAVDEFSQCQSVQETWHSDEFQQWLIQLRDNEHVDWAGVIAAKLQILEQLYQCFCEQHLTQHSYRAQSFEAFCQQGGHGLWQHAVFEALQEDLLRQNADYVGWHNWPRALQDPDSEEVKAFAAEQQSRVRFYMYLQWLAHSQLNEVGLRCLNLKRGIGLYQCLAASVNPAGPDTWRNPNLYALSMRMGSAPEALNTFGPHMFGAPMRPDQLAQQGYQPVIECLRHNMRYCGALRLSHLSTWLRAFWVPQDCEHQRGAYVNYDADAILAIIALESQRQQCLVVAEDPKMLPPQLSDKLHQYGILTEQVLYFEKADEYSFKAPTDYHHDSVATVTSHELPTLTQYWSGQDLELRQAQALFPSAEIRQREVTQRASDRAALLLALEKHALLPEGLSADPAQLPEMTAELAIAVYDYLSQAPSRMLMVQLENVLCYQSKVNLAGDAEHYINWGGRFAVELEDLLEQPLIWRVSEMLKQTHRAQPLLSWRESTAPLAVDAVPDASYRLQLNADFTLQQAAAQLDYLQALGISHVYASPILAARAGSSHGYDVTDHQHINPDIGGEAAFAQFSEQLKQRGMRLIVDIVPNHMVVMGKENTWWLDVLENGPASLYADYFDIDWNPVKKELKAKVLVPALGGPYGQILSQNELVLQFDAQAGAFGVWYYDHLFPIDPSTYPDILSYRLDALIAQLGTTDPQLAEFKSLIAAFKHLPDRSCLDTESQEERHRDKQIHKQRLAQLCGHCSAIDDFIQANVRAFNMREDEEHLHPLLEKQAYRLAFWRTAAEEINYRRFFDINELAGLRMENARVFEATHRLIFELIDQKKIHGLRIDHADGLNDPTGYFHWLSRGLSSPLRRRQVYLVAEKILAPYESLPADWEVDGTTGYDGLSAINGLFVDARHEQAFTELYQAFIGQPVDFEHLVYINKRRIMRSALASELNVLANRLNQIAESSPMTRDFTLNSLREALLEITACFPVYRTYVAAHHVADTDQHYVEWAVAQAKKRTGMTDLMVFDFVRDALLLRLSHADMADIQDDLVAFAMSYQQFTSPVMAKGVEDTSFYVYNRLTSLNEVGCEPSRFGCSPSAFHHANQYRRQHWPHNMLCSTTHDTKRSEDTRARLHVLSEIPALWQTHLVRWHRINSRLRVEVEGQVAPSCNDEYLLYQTLLSTWPFADWTSDEQRGVYVQRICDYMIKAAREAKVCTSWLNTNQAYESALCHFIEELVAGQNNSIFMDDFMALQQQVAALGVYNSLSQTVLKLTMPGVPDIYQGTELWDFSLVDPDNRRPVDYVLRQQQLQALQQSDRAITPHCLTELLRNVEDGRIKLWLTSHLLNLRRQHSTLFKLGDYQALDVQGALAEHVCAFARQFEQQRLVVVVPRILFELTQGGKVTPMQLDWQDSCVQLPDDWALQQYRDVLTQQTHLLHNQRSLALCELFSQCPFAVLLAETGG